MKSSAKFETSVAFVGDIQMSRPASGSQQAQISMIKAFLANDFVAWQSKSFLSDKYNFMLKIQVSQIPKCSLRFNLL